MAIIRSILASGLALLGGAASAATVQLAQLDDVTLSPIAVGSEVSGQSFTFAWDISGGDTGLPGISAAIQFSLPGRAKVSFDDYTSNAAGQQTGFVLYQLGGDVLTAEAPSGTTGGGVPLVNDVDRVLIGEAGGAIGEGTVLYDGIGGTDAFRPAASGNDWVLGIFDSGNPSVGSATFTITAVPLPASGLLLMGAVGALALRARRAAA